MTCLSTASAACSVRVPRSVLFPASASSQTQAIERQLDRQGFATTVRIVMVFLMSQPILGSSCLHFTFPHVVVVNVGKFEGVNILNLRPSTSIFIFRRRRHAPLVPKGVSKGKYWTIRPFLRTAGSTAELYNTCHTGIAVSLDTLSKYNTVGLTAFISLRLTALSANIFRMIKTS